MFPDGFIEPPPQILAHMLEPVKSASAGSWVYALVQHLRFRTHDFYSGRRL